MVSFSHIPNDLRVPLFYAEMDNSAAGTMQTTSRILLIGQSSNDEFLNIPKLAASEGTVANIAGQGSMLLDMFKGVRLNDTMREVWILPIADAEASVAAKGSITISGTAQENGVISLYIAGKLVSIPVVNFDSATAIAASIVTAVNQNSDIVVTAAATGATVNLTAKWKGLTGNDIDLRINYVGLIGGEQTPQGINITINKMSGGLLNPEIETALANLGDEEYDFIAMPYTDTTNLNAFRDFMSDKTGRWSYAKQIYGHGYAAKVANTAEAQTFGKTRNDQHFSILPYSGSPTPPWKVVSMLIGSIATPLTNDPARPVQSLSITGFDAPDIADRFTISERNTLLFNGMSTFAVQNGSCQVERIVTTYREDAYGQADNSYLDVETLYTSAYVIRFLRQRILQKYPRFKLAQNGARFAPGVAVVTPNILKSELIAAYEELEAMGIVENSAIFAQYLIVEISATDPNRVNVLFPPDYVNQLRIFAVLNQFRLNY